MRQRVCIAMALATQPELLDRRRAGHLAGRHHPGPDSAPAARLVTEKNTSVILITHTLGVVREMTDRVYVMYAGTMVELAPTRRCSPNRCHPYTRGPDAVGAPADRRRRR